MRRRTTSRTFLVTGAGKGVGLALAHHLAGRDHHVVGLARNRSAGFPGTLMTSHLADGAATGAALADRIAFDGVVDNVGLVRPQWLGAVGISALDEVLRVNLHPALRAVQALLPGMRQRGWGRGRRRRQPDRPRQHRAHGLRGRQGGARQRHLLPGARTGHDPDHRR